MVDIAVSPPRTPGLSIQSPTLMDLLTGRSWTAIRSIVSLVTPETSAENPLHLLLLGIHCGQRSTDGGSSDAECRGDRETLSLLAEGAGKFGAFGRHN